MPAPILRNYGKMKLEYFGPKADPQDDTKSRMKRTSHPATRRTRGKRSCEMKNCGAAADSTKTKEQARTARAEDGTSAHQMGTHCSPTCRATCGASSQRTAKEDKLAF